MHLRTLGRFLCVLLLLAPLGSALADADGGAPSIDVEGRWRWEVPGAVDAGAVSAPRREDYWLEFLPDGKLTFKADCNAGSGSWALKGTALAVTPQATTLMACPPGSLDTTFLQHVQGTSRVSFDGPNLVLRRISGAGEVRFSRVHVSGTLTRAPWVLVVVEAKGVDMPVDAEYRVEFRPGGTLRWKGPCQEGAGSWSMSAQRLTVHAAAFGTPSCAQTAGTPDFAHLLNQTARYRLEGNQLILESPPQSLRLRPAGKPL
jgi:heat shock protein HslJ